MTQSNTATAPQPRADVLVEMTTSQGPVTLRLFGDTPKHLENFTKLAREGYYDGMLFHRVIKDFMVQTGDPDSKNAPTGKLLGMGNPGYQIDAEIVYPRHFHRRGALAAARQDDSTNPQRKSSGSQFYIVTGHTYTPAELDKLEMNLIRSQKQAVVNNLLSANRDTIMTLRRNRDQAGLQQLQDSLQAEARKIASTLTLGFTPEQIEAYTTVGGAPHLDAAYTVFGQVEKGYEVIDAIQQVDVDRNNRPLDDVKILSMKVIE
ncbi:MAG: peptidylprolyl isomerase [Firmicutes bacterium]|nr:peptidylprolyl isomerase [Bacillota bacterium]MCM1402045.1 peptidylprolyl isomerase [Bacteroides sp.]MCM1476778.1 peptidylprolyl isomerase [Bacteroides sp.]